MTVGLALGGCSADDVANPAASPTGRSAASGFTVREVWSGLEQPTQMALLDDGRLVVAQLSGAENAKTGSIVAVDLESGQTDVWFDELDKPTGVAVIGDTVWIMERRRLSRGPVGGGEVEVVLPNLAFNGRSEGTLTGLADGSLLFNTSGSRDGSERRAGSATVWRFDPITLEQTEFAVGIQNGYARVVDSDGLLWSTDIFAGSDETAFGDAVVPVQLGDDGGWPQCAASGEPVPTFGGTIERCAERPQPAAVFAAGSTPTSIEIAPWDNDLLVVALWSSGEVVLVPRTVDSASTTTFDLLYEGFEHPQHVLVVADEVFVSDHASGRVVAVSSR